MKTKIIEKFSLALILISCLFFLPQCRKSTSDPAEPVTGQRITGITIYMNDTATMSSVINYSGNRIAEEINSIGTGLINSKTVFAYAGNRISSYSNYTKSGAGWRKTSTTEISGYSGDNPSEILNHYYNESGSEISTQRTLYIFEAEVPKRMETYYSYSGTWQLVRIASYKYDSIGRIISESDTLGGYGNTVVHTYSGNHRTETLSQEWNQGTATNDSRFTYEYAGDLLSVYTGYEWKSGAWTESSRLEFGYNDQGNIKTGRNTIIGEPGSYRYEVSYEAGTGNYRQCMKTGTDGFLFPGDPSPYPVKSANPGLTKGSKFIDK
jgi:hypothetical protein